MQTQHTLLLKRHKTCFIALLLLCLTLEVATMSRFETYCTRREAINELLIDQLLLHLNATLSSDGGSLCILCIHTGLPSTKILSLIDEMFNCFNGLSWLEEHTVLHFTLTQTKIWLKPLLLFLTPPCFSHLME